ncbi:hypothetical protein MPTK1_4g17820 [Marchantia polymorpha subsp. ruderalis]|uniref:Uncharacterized protein n=2 Tax=Marchantia polymorpha TaxID=3197 RepID=A0A176WGE4_MARPO|nr:hypothetical protein AXG93_1793s1290 [Marchantia polymorpha subsp. ruderalis]PTQ40168.1 hypothetical protein MARPO_0041s0063 [Marchantia polymorpha]BBN09180.1 hypothetical protein Mp_4g17820 [Marchantia polymorpha subsp. ruderalis]|eukprot:PTQ40168.1 hypothetical protein MARPO_0041s0063 [Marchantia polymorpha]
MASEDSELGNGLHAAEKPDHFETSGSEKNATEREQDSSAGSNGVNQDMANKPEPNTAKRTTKFFQEKVRQAVRYGHGDFDFTRPSSADCAQDFDDSDVNPWGPVCAKDIIASILRPAHWNTKESCKTQINQKSPISLATCSE